MSKSRFLKLGSLFAALLMVFSLAAIGSAEARMGGSFGSRGMRTFQSAPITGISPNIIAPGSCARGKHRRVGRSGAMFGGWCGASAPAGQKPAS